MTGIKLLSRLLQMKGFKVTWYELLSEEKLLHLGVKPDKNGCRCPHCARRGVIVARAQLRVWQDVIVCGMRSFFFMLRQKFSVRHTVECRRGFPGLIAIPA